VWLDNVRITSIGKLNYTGPDIPAIEYEPDSLITDWEVIGPLTKPVPEIERARDPFTQIRMGRARYAWKPFPVDARGTVITAKVTEYMGERTVAYFRTLLQADVEDAWYDFWTNPEHAGRRIPVELKAGENQLVFRSRNGQYASGGFFARIEAP
jgi:hypothetical protein